jgi:hypothetical protein
LHDLHMHDWVELEKKQIEETWRQLKPEEP